MIKKSKYSKNKFKKSELGFSNILLVSLLAGLSVVGISTAYINNKSLNQRLQKMGNQNNADAAVNAVINYLSNPVNCTAYFGQTTVNAITSSSLLNINAATFPDYIKESLANNKVLLKEFRVLSTAPTIGAVAETAFTDSKDIRRYRFELLTENQYNSGVAGSQSENIFSKKYGTDAGTGETFYLLTYQQSGANKTCQVTKEALVATVGSDLAAQKSCEGLGGTFNKNTNRCQLASAKYEVENRFMDSMTSMIDSKFTMADAFCRTEYDTLSKSLSTYSPEQLMTIACQKPRFSGCQLGSTYLVNRQNARTVVYVGSRGQLDSKINEFFSEAMSNKADRLSREAASTSEVFATAENTVEPVASSDGTIRKAVSRTKAFMHQAQNIGTVVFIAGAVGGLLAAAGGAIAFIGTVGAVIIIAIAIFSNCNDFRITVDRVCLDNVVESTYVRINQEQFGCKKWKCGCIRWPQIAAVEFPISDEQVYTDLKDAFDRIKANVTSTITQTTPSQLSNLTNIINGIGSGLGLGTGSGGSNLSTPISTASNITIGQVSSGGNVRQNYHRFSAITSGGSASILEQTYTTANAYAFDKPPLIPNPVAGEPDIVNVFSGIDQTKMANFLNSSPFLGTTDVSALNGGSDTAVTLDDVYQTVGEYYQFNKFQIRDLYSSLDPADDPCEDRSLIPAAGETTPLNVGEPLSDPGEPNVCAELPAAAFVDGPYRAIFDQRENMLLTELQQSFDSGVAPINTSIGAIGLMAYAETTFLSDAQSIKGMIDATRNNADLKSLMNTQNPMSSGGAIAAQTRNSIMSAYDNHIRADLGESHNNDSGSGRTNMYSVVEASHTALVDQYVSLCTVGKSKIDTLISDAESASTSLGTQIGNYEISKSNCSLIPDAGLTIPQTEFQNKCTPGTTSTTSTGCRADCENYLAPLRTRKSTLDGHITTAKNSRDDLNATTSPSRDCTNTN